MSSRPPIQLDRSSGVPIHVQLVTRLRYLIVSGHFRDRDGLPSTRELSRQLGISFHTVRKAYQTLVDSRHLEARKGSGYRVSGADPGSKAERMERGAQIVHESLQQLIGLGLDELEIEYLIQEQSSILETEEDTYKIVLAGPYREWAMECGEKLGTAFQRDIVSATLSELRHHADADFVLVPFRFVRAVLSEMPNADVIGVQPEIGGEALDQVARLLERETMGLVTQFPDAIGPLTSALREQTGFGGQILAISVGDGDTHLEPLLEQCELVLHTESAWKTSRSTLSKAGRRVSLRFEITSASVDRLRQFVPH